MVLLLPRDALANLLAGSLEMTYIDATVHFARCADTHDREFGFADRANGVRCSVQTAGIARFLNELVNPLFQNRTGPGIQRLDLRRVDVHPNDPVSPMSQASGRDRSHVT